MHLPHAAGFDHVIRISGDDSPSNEHVRNAAMDEQVNLMKPTRVLCAPHGAGLTNMMVCGLKRKSLDVEQNLAPRAVFYRKHRLEMLRAGVAHLFLMESANRQLRASWTDHAPVRKLALAAAWDRPQSMEPYRMLIRLSPVGSALGKVRERFG